MRHTLLLADDSVTIQRVIELTFADEDIRVVAVSDGAQAVRHAQEEPPDIVLADVGMPEMDGYEVAAFIKQTSHLSHIPVLLLTGAFEPIDEGRARAVGCDGVLVKPFEPQMVISRVKELISGRPPAGPRPVLAPLSQPPSVTPPAPATDEYFDRLDAALAQFDATATNPSDPSTTPARIEDEPTLLLPSASAASQLRRDESESAASQLRRDESASAASQLRRDESASAASQLPRDQPAASVLADAFEALLAVEQGRPLESPAAQRLASSDTLIEHITRQVIERLADDRMKDVVLEVAERLVREEIDRIKSAAGN